ncbi:MAG: LPS assembly protein LptD [Hyphomonadaceae bacterium]|jgi:LPS-assembly protein|nr:LPS assembly protein LptD [Hyphomonadaceae bacterium]
MATASALVLAAALASVSGTASARQAAAQPAPSTRAPAAPAPVAAEETLTTIGQSARAIITPGPDILLEADELKSSGDGRAVEAIGNVVARSGGRTINAARITYDSTTGIVEAFGSVTIIEADGTSSFAESVRVEDDLASGIVSSFSARLPGGAVIAANAAIRESATRNRLSRVIYTACPVCEDGSPPTWAIRARRAVQDQELATISYSDVVLEVLGQPVAYVPYFAHPDPSAKRQSGFLPAFPASNSRLGLHLQVPYLLVLDPHSDVTMAPLLSEHANPVLEVRARRRFHSGLLELTGSATYERLFGNDGMQFDDEQFRGHIFGSGRFAINEDWHWGFGAEHATDDTYLLRYGFSGEGQTRGPIRAESGRLVSQIYLEGQSADFYARVLALDIQDLTGGLRRQLTPQVLPSAELRHVRPFGPMNGRLETSANLVVLDRARGLTDSARVSAGLGWSAASMVGNGIIVTPSLLARADGFAYRGAAIPGDDRFGRIVGQAGVDVRWPLERIAQSGRVELEPRLNLTLATDDSRSDDVIVGEIEGYELDRPGLFDTSGVAGVDQWQAGARLTAGLAAGWTGQGRTRLDGFVGIQWRDRDDSRFARSTNLDRSTSDVIGEVELAFEGLGSVRARLRYDPELGELARTEAWASVSMHNLSAEVRFHHSTEAAFGPRYANQEWQGGLRYQFARNWQVFGAGLYNANEDRTLLGRFGFIYLDDCTELRLFYERSGVRNQLVEPSDGFRIQLALRSFGSLTGNIYEPRW